MNYNISIEQDESWMYVWEVLDLPWCYTQASTMPELFDRLLEVSEWRIQLMNVKKWLLNKFKCSLHMEYASA